MTDFVVVTTIFQPSEALKKLACCENLRLVIVGDKKTPSNWHIEGAKAQVDFLCCDKKAGYKIENVLPYNHYCRKMIGYIYAKKNGAELIYETDDDNYPKDNFYTPDFNKEILFSPEDKGFVNIYKYYTDQDIWARGFPLDLITDEKNVLCESELIKDNKKIGVYQGLVDNEPDVDAIYRLVSNQKCNFKQKEPVALSRGTICPYNSQNTFTVKEMFPLLYLPCTVTFRFTDILRGLIAQPLMWSEGYHLAFTTSTAIQERNIHDYMKDFKSEIPVYLHAKDVVEIAASSIRKDLSLNDNILNVYNALLEAKIVEEEEIKILEAYLSDIS